MAERIGRGNWWDGEAEREAVAANMGSVPPFHFPEPGERDNASGIPMADHAVAALLVGAAIALHVVPCPAKDCENCNEHRKVWWDACNALARTTRIRLQRWLRDEGYPLPAAPWEDEVE